MRIAAYLGSFVTITSTLSMLVLQSSVYAIFLPSPSVGLSSFMLLAALLFSLPVITSQTYTGVLVQWIGWGLVVTALVGGLFTPTYFGLLYNYIAAADLPTILATGICYLLIGLEFPHKSIRARVADIWLEYEIRFQLWRAQAKTWLVTHA